MERSQMVILSSSMTLTDEAQMFPCKRFRKDLQAEIGSTLTSTPTINQEKSSDYSSSELPVTHRSMTQRMTSEC